MNNYVSDESDQDMEYDSDDSPSLSGEDAQWYEGVQSDEDVRLDEDVQPFEDASSDVDMRDDGESTDSDTSDYGEEYHWIPHSYSDNEYWPETSDEEEDGAEQNGQQSPSDVEDSPVVQMNMPEKCAICWEPLKRGEPILFVGCCTGTTAARHLACEMTWLRQEMRSHVQGQAAQVHLMANSFVDRCPACRRGNYLSEHSGLGASMENSLGGDALRREAASDNVERPIIEGQERQLLYNAIVRISRIMDRTDSIVDEKKNELFSKYGIRKDHLLVEELVYGCKEFKWPGAHLNREDIRNLYKEFVAIFDELDLYVEYERIIPVDDTGL